MKRYALLMLAISGLVGCTQYKKLTGQEHEGSGADNGQHLIASVGTLPVSGTLTFAPVLDSSETLVSVKVRIAGVLTGIDTTPSAGPYYAFDKPSGVLSVYNYAGEIAVYYQSPYAAGTHSLS